MLARDSDQPQPLLHFLVDHLKYFLIVCGPTLNRRSAFVLIRIDERLSDDADSVSLTEAVVFYAMSLV
jgi:hypothetical protein